MATLYTYLPFHPMMHKLIKVGMRVVHNGGNGRQGDTGYISKICGEVRVQFDNGGSYAYTAQWFFANFWIGVDSINEMRGPFNREGFIAKYDMYKRTKKGFTAKVYETHQSMKEKEDSKNREGTAQDFEEVVALESSSDEVGTFLSCRIDGKGIPTMHKTLRMAEFKAQQESGRDGAERHILKVVSVVKAKPITTYEVSTERK